MGATRCSHCGRDLKAMGQRNMGTPAEPLCEDCWCGAVGGMALRDLRALRDRVGEQDGELCALRKKWHRALGKLEDRERELREARARVKDLEEQVEHLERAREIPPSLARELATRAAEECAMWIGEIEEDE